MTARRSPLRGLLVVVAALAATAGPTVAVIDHSAARSVSAPCVNGVVPLNPNVVNCNLPQRSRRIPGQAPDAGALVACKGSPQCLSYFVNYPGQTVFDSGLWSPGNQ